MNNDVRAQAKQVEKEVVALKKQAAAELTSATERMKVINKMLNNGTGELVYRAIFRHL